MMRKVLLTLSIVVGALTAYSQGVTTSSMTGRIVDANGEPLIGATVVATHGPTGSEWGNVADVDGYFRLANMKVGGPYTVVVSFVGFESQERNNVFLSLGQRFNMNFELSESATALEEIVISTSYGEIFDGNRNGAETFVSLETINSMPTVSRSIGDFARLNPQASIDEGNDGQEISIGGMNNRLNAIYIDGAVNNDVFGLAASGTNGGQTGVSPISVDAIEQISISVAPFDVRQSGFAGGSINAVTRSGSNNVEGSAYYFWRNEGLAGKTPIEDDQEDLERTKLDDFKAETYGFRLGGPIIKNKLFFFVNGEVQRDETPQPLTFANYDGNATQAEIDNLRNSVISTYGYDPGVYDNNTAFLNSDKFLGKLDFNINQDHKLTLRHSYTKSENLEARRSDANTIGFINGSEFFISKTNSSALELKSAISNTMSNVFTLGATFVRDDRDPLGDPFPAVTIDDGQGEIVFGAETFSTANLLNQDIITFNNNLEIYKGRHTLVVGANLELYKTKNLFIPFNFGDYEYGRSTPIGASNLADFLAGENPDFFIRSYSLRDNITGDETSSAIEFSGSQLGFYVQDDYQASDKLKLTFGLRGDISFFEDTPSNAAFNTTTIPLLEQFYDLGGAETGQFIDPQVYISPRIGFNYDVKGDQTTQLRGGAGIFTSRIPLVWPGGAYNNFGLNRGTYLSFGSDPFNPDINTQPPGAIDPNNPTPSGDIDLFVDNFKIPQVAKFNLALDKKLGNGFIATFEGIYTKFINNVYYQNVNLRPSVGNLEGADNRALFDRRDEIDDTYGRIILGSNTNKGYTYNLTASVTKEFDWGLSGMFSYSYSDAHSIYDGTSSQNSSQWRGLHAINGRNFWNETARSDFAQGSRILGQFSYTKEYGNFMSSQLSLIYEGKDGNLFTYIYGSGDDLVSEDSRNRELVYVPRDQSEINLVDYVDGSGNTVTAAQQWADLDAFINQDEYLSERRGDYAERNQSRTPFESILDVRFLQSFYIDMSNGTRNTLQFSVDIFNFSNLLNKKWGRRYNRVQGGYELLEFEGFQTGTNAPTFTYRGFNGNQPYHADFKDFGAVSARYQIQLGLRYIFGG